MRVFAGSLETLEIDRTLSDLNLPGSQHGQHDNTDIDHRDVDQLVLPLVTRLRLFVNLKSGRDLQEVTSLCPNTEELSSYLDRASSPPLKEGLEYLRAHCDKIRSLRLQNYSPQNQLSAEIIESCSVTGLTSLELSGCNVSDKIVAAVMTQAGTLERLNIFTHPYDLAVKRGLLLLTELSRLKELRLRVRIDVRSLEEVDTWGSGPWARDLEMLYLRAVTNRVDDQHNGDDDGDDSTDSDSNSESDAGVNIDDSEGVGRVLQRGEEALIDKVFEQVERLKHMRCLSILVNGVPYSRRPSK